MRFVLSNLSSFVITSIFINVCYVIAGKKKRRSGGDVSMMSLAT